MQKQILVIEDEEIARKNLEHILAKEGYKVVAVDSGTKGLNLIKSRSFDLIITDYKMKKVDGIQILEHSRELQPYTEVIMITGFATVDCAVTAMKEGAYHYIAKPYKIEEVRRIIKEALLKRSLQLENMALKDAMKKEGHLPFIIGNSKVMGEVKKTIDQIARTDISILILGESGTGKELVAKAIHSQSNRYSHEMVAFNCGSFSEELMANELFGHEKGAFTGASRLKRGKFEMADQGTIFLDEIGDLPFPVQAKLLKVLDDGEIRRLGGTRTIKVNCIVIAATNRNLEKLVQQKKFRQDLYFRLNIFPVHIPPLRKRREDILKISNFYLKKYNKIYKQKKRFSENCLEQIQAHDFPGNVRELKNIIKNAVVIKEKDVLDKIISPGITRQKSRHSSSFEDRKSMVSQGLNEELLEFERKKLEKAMARFDSTRDLANHLGISQSTVVRKMKKHGLSLD